MGKLEEEENEPLTERRREYSHFGLDLGEREEQVACYASCLSLDFGDDRLDMSGNKDAGLTIFITTMGRSKSLISFTNRFFHFRRPPGLRWRLARPKVMENLAPFSAREVNRTAKEEKDEYFTVEAQ